MFVNEDHVERVEGGTNSAVHMTNGTYLIVRDDVATINERIRMEKVTLLARAMAVVGFEGIVPSPVTALPAGGAADGQP